ncbi:MAG: TadE/TadG family type IV pilus assembly protein [Planctomycetota bacterium]
MRKQRRRGAALVEFALCLPLFLIIGFGTLETCRMLYLRQSLKIAAYEAARIAIVPEVDADAVEAQCDLILSGRNIADYEFSCVPADPNTAGFGEVITVTASVDAASYAIVGGWFYQGEVVTQSVSIMAEY